ncbi:MAG: photosystem I assembly protein Ycf3 [bacterium ADurb.Bin212]|nr:MAG: photosystem I assembly protein Ycf3 [bacterium ADurb.Bin212]
MKASVILKSSLIAIFAVVLTATFLWLTKLDSKNDLDRMASASDISDAKGLLLTKNYSECVDKLKYSDFESDSDIAQANNVLGQCNYALKDYASALEHFERTESLLKDKKQLSSLQNLMANTYRDMGEKNQAAIYYQKALDNNPANQQASINYSYSLLAEGDKINAQNVINEAMLISPNNEELIKIKLSIENGA